MSRPQHQNKKSFRTNYFYTSLNWNFYSSNKVLCGIITKKIKSLIKDFTHFGLLKIFHFFLSKIDISAFFTKPNFFQIYHQNFGGAGFGLIK